MDDVVGDDDPAAEPEARDLAGADALVGGRAGDPEQLGDLLHRVGPCGLRWGWVVRWVVHGVLLREDRIPREPTWRETSEEPLASSSGRRQHLSNTCRSTSYPQVSDIASSDRVCSLRFRDGGPNRSTFAGATAGTG